MAQQVDFLIIGAGLTGLTTAFTLHQRGCRVAVLEAADRIGGQVRSYYEKGYTFESGPNTGVLAFPEVAELFEEVAQATGQRLLTVANPEAKKRLIWKGGRFHSIPHGAWSGIRTPLIPFSDKIRLFFEPWRSKGTDPDESIAATTRRRLGASFVTYFVDPFVSGIYAGDPERIVTRWAMPKLYDLEQRHGSFIRGAYAKRRSVKTERDRLATREVFSALGGMEALTTAMAGILSDEIVLSCRSLSLHPEGATWKASFEKEGKPCVVSSPRVVLTTPAYTLPSLLPFLPAQQLLPITSLVYAPVVQVCVGMPTYPHQDFMAFGGLVPSCEKENILGVLFPSSCFPDRAPEGCVTLSFFLGGVKNPHFIEKTDEEIRGIVFDALHRMLRFPAEATPDVMKIFRHRRAIPQYEKSTGERLAAVAAIERAYPGLSLAGNLRDGIGLAHRICQGRRIAETLVESVKKGG